MERHRRSKWSRGKVSRHKDNPIKKASLAQLLNFDNHEPLENVP
ncbi:11187_t:CDS:2, partial [Rhizophagus irregularis]